MRSDLVNVPVGRAAAADWIASGAGRTGLRAIAAAAILFGASKNVF
jgi:hypothetical protein